MHHNRNNYKFLIVAAACCFLAAGCIDTSDFVKYVQEPEPNTPVEPFVPEDPVEPPPQGDDIIHPGGSGGIIGNDDDNPQQPGTNPGGGQVIEEEVPAIELVTPSSGDIQGGYEVRLHGTKLDDSGTIFFGSIQAPEQIYVNANVIRTTVPAGKKGCVDVTFENGDTKLTLEKGFCYTQDIQYENIAPNIAIANSSVEIQIDGSGFDETTRVFFSNGEQTLPLVDPRLQNENRITGLLPVLNTGSITLTLVSEFGYAQIPDALQIVAPFEFSSITPDLIQTGTTPQISIAGDGFDDKTRIRIESQNIQPTFKSPQQLTFQAPAMPAGSYDVLLYNDLQQLRLESALHYYENTGKPQILTLSPKSGSTLGGTQVAIRGVSLPTQGNASFGKTNASVVKRSESEWTVKTPKHDAGLTDVTVGSATLPDAYEFVQIASGALKLTSISPQNAVVSDETQIQLKGSGFDKNTRIFFGPWEATQLTVTNASTIKATIPKGAGTVPVQAIRGNERSNTLQFTYDEDISIITVTPNQSVFTGKTTVDIYGTGFTKDMTLKIDDKTIETVYHNPTHLSFTAPSHKAGTESIPLMCSDQTECGKFDFTWFNPTGINTSASGSPISGELHVTVLTVDTAVPIPYATVYVGSNPKTALTGTTDAKGRVSFFDDSLKNAQIVIACAPEHSCNTLQPVNATNITLLLEDWHADDLEPPGEESPEPPPPSDGSIINPIEIVVPFTPTQPYFSGTVGTFGKVELVSDPNLVRAGFVMQSALSPYMMSHDKEDVYLILEEGAKYRIKARKGDVALALVCGLYDVNTSAFYPKYLGVKRHQFVTDGAEIVNHLECPLPLNQTQSIKFVNTPVENFDQISASAYIFVGSEGYLGGFMNSASLTDLTVIPNLPPLRDTIADANFTFVVNAVYNASQNTPSYTYFYQYNVIPDGSMLEVGPTVSRPTFLTTDSDDILKTGFIAWKIANPEFVDFYALTVRLYASGRSDLLYQFYLPGSATTAEFPTLFEWPKEEGYKQLIVQLTAYKSVRNGFDFNKFSTGDLRYNYIESSATANLVITPDKINGTKP